jgi:hypothetical protein
MFANLEGSDSASVYMCMSTVQYIIIWKKHYMLKIFSSYLFVYFELSASRNVKFRVVLYT